eukprot:CAMPEP_0119325524 /NCGR_PEP_ID=MMETSP1333-20130426/66031_1 /TAXON_ID=418940 /ORGANISM="Scyphosphaera apsteinii, Strain RCC1455" /LENGTH=731 /DNA_ID=CAMNT_0007333537 /DNA_START=105 /DNA_END=2301 /DNA_ORIENTATION=+
MCDEEGSEVGVPIGIKDKADMPHPASANTVLQHLSSDDDKTQTPAADTSMIPLEMEMHPVISRSNHVSSSSTSSPQAPEMPAVLQLQSDTEFSMRGPDREKDAPLERLHLRLERCAVAVGIALITSCCHFNLVSLYFVASAVCRHTDFRRSKVSRSHWLLRDRTYWFILAIAILDAFYVIGICVLLFFTKILLSCAGVSQVITTAPSPPRQSPILLPSPPPPPPAAGVCYDQDGSNACVMLSRPAGDRPVYYCYWEECDRRLGPVDPQFRCEMPSIGCRQCDPDLRSRKMRALSHDAFNCPDCVLEILNTSPPPVVEPNPPLHHSFTPHHPPASFFTSPLPSPPRIISELTVCDSQYGKDLSANELLDRIQAVTFVLALGALLITLTGFTFVLLSLIEVLAVRRFAPLALQIHVTLPESPEEGPVPYRSAVARTVTTLRRQGRLSVVNGTKFEVRKLITGQAIDSALGILSYMGVDEETVLRGKLLGLAMIEREIKEHGTDDDRECLHYLMHQQTGASQRSWSNGVMDIGRPTGQTLQDFVDHKDSKKAGLSAPHVLALRLYTCNVYRSINNALRHRRSAGEPYPFPVTLVFLSDAIRKLRAVAATRPGANVPQDLWRGMAGLVLDERFSSDGGTEIAPMSTTNTLTVAVAYALGNSDIKKGSLQQALLMKLSTASFIDRGADLSYLSCFPNEQEVCYPPLTYLSPTGRQEDVMHEGITWTIIEVEPRFSS